MFPSWWERDLGYKGFGGRKALLQHFGGRRDQGGATALLAADFGSFLDLESLGF